MNSASNVGGHKMTVKIILAGPRGKMGQEAIKMIQNEDGFELVACIDKESSDKLNTSTSINVPVYCQAETCFSEITADVYIDLTIPEVGFAHSKLALTHQIHTVVGTSGFTEMQIQELTNVASQHKVGCLIAPNFALGAVLMMLFSKMAATYFPDVEIIEKHHDNKIDAPSGTATKTVEMIQQTRKSKLQGHPDEYEIIPGARGADNDGIRVHSMRLPGLVAHQEVVFGGNSQLLTIKHDSFHRESFMDGLKLAINEVRNLQTLVYGLENVMDIN